MNENEADHQHSSPIKTPKQLVVVVVLAFVVPIAAIVLITQLVTGVPHPSGDDAMVRARIAPVGTVEMAAATAPQGTMTGEQVFASTCKTCHEAGIAGAHKLGDKAAWAKVIAQGEKVTVAHAIAGICAMPPRGGNPSLTDEEVQRGVAFMTAKAGANWKEAPVAAAPAVAAAGGDRSGQQVVEAVCSKCHANGTGGAPKVGDRTAWIERAKRGLEPVVQSALRGHAGMPARGGMAEISDVEIRRAVEFMMHSGTAAAAAPAAAPVVAAAAPAAAAPADGKKVFDGACAACHGAGIAGAPKFGDKAAWAPRIAQGSATLYQHALNGFQGKSGVMPPKGGSLNLSDAEVKAAVDTMVAAGR